MSMVVRGDESMHRGESKLKFIGEGGREGEVPFRVGTSSSTIFTTATFTA
jgi:hypothetical protein